MTYKILIEGVEIEGVAQEVGAVVELTEEVAAPMLADGKIELVVEAEAEAAAPAPADEAGE